MDKVSISSRRRSFYLLSINGLHQFNHAWLPDFHGQDYLSVQNVLSVIMFVVPTAVCIYVSIYEEGFMIHFCLEKKNIFTFSDDVVDLMFIHYNLWKMCSDTIYLLSTYRVTAKHIYHPCASMHTLRKIIHPCCLKSHLNIPFCERLPPSLSAQRLAKWKKSKRV